MEITAVLYLKKKISSKDLKSVDIYWVLAIFLSIIESITKFTWE